MIKLVQEFNDESALLELVNEYSSLIEVRLANFRIKRNNYDDFYQECLIVFVNCVKKYDKTKGLSFCNYCDLSIKNKIKNLLRNNRYYFYNVLTIDLDVIDAIEYKNDDDNDDDILELSEEMDPILSEYERKIDSYHRLGISSKDIARLTNDDVRSVYNAIQRINKKRKEIKNNNKRISLTKEEAKERLKDVCLSKMEYDVYLLYLLGNKSCDISKSLNLNINQVYDAIRRVNKKLKY